MCEGELVRLHGCTCVTVDLGHRSYEIDLEALDLLVVVAKCAEELVLDVCLDLVVLVVVEEDRTVEGHGAVGR